MRPETQCRAYQAPDGSWPEPGDSATSDRSELPFRFVEVGSHIITQGPGLADYVYATVRETDWWLLGADPRFTISVEAP